MLYRTDAGGGANKAVEASWRRVSTAFHALEGAFFARRKALAAQQSPGDLAQENANPAALSTSRRLSELGIGPHSSSGLLGSSQQDHLSAFTSDLSKFVRYSKLKVRPSSMPAAL